MKKASGRFSEEKLRKRLSAPGAPGPSKPVMPAKAGIHAFRASPVPTPIPPGQKFFAQLRAPMTERERGLNRAAQLCLKKATSYFWSHPHAAR
jgi:hypothetical protein